MPTQILLINVHSDANAGDAALTQTAVQQLEQSFPDSEITVVMNDRASYQGRTKATGSFQNWIKDSFPDRPAKWHYGALLRLVVSSLVISLSFRMIGRPFYKIAPRPWQELFRAYVESSLIVSAAGGFLYSSGKMGITLLYNIFTLVFAWALGKPFYLLPQSIGPLQNRKDQRLVRWILEKARIVMVREAISIEELEKTGLKHPRLMLVPDLALAFQGDPPEAAQSWLASQGISLDPLRQRMGITAINWQVENFRFRSQAVYEQALEDTARCFIEKYDGEIFFFTQVHGPTPGQDDRIPAQRIYQKLAEHQNRIHRLFQPVPPALLQALYGEMDVLIGTRLHSVIFALGRQVPILAVGYQYKTQGITRMLGLERWSIPIEEVNGKKLTQMLKDLWDHRAEVSRQMEENLPKLIQQSAQAGALIAEDYDLFLRTRTP
jgi:colanic acid/amylovoran biosynthesis protein